MCRYHLNTSTYGVSGCGFTITCLQVILGVGIEIPAHAAGPPHELGAELDVNGPAAPLPRQGEALLLRHQHVLGDLLQLQVVDVVRQLQTGQRGDGGGQSK